MPAGRMGRARGSSTPLHPLSLLRAAQSLKPPRAWHGAALCSSTVAAAHPVGELDGPAAAAVSLRGLSSCSTQLRTSAVPCRARPFPRGALCALCAAPTPRLALTGKRRYDRKQAGFGGQTKPVFHKKVGLRP